jgi:hypothetical protein
MTRENIDSREAFTAEAQAAYGWNLIEADEPSQADLDEMCDYFESLDFDDDGQHDEYTEWQDLYGGDDCYDHYDEY